MNIQVELIGRRWQVSASLFLHKKKKRHIRRRVQPVSQRRELSPARGYCCPLKGTSVALALATLQAEAASSRRTRFSALHCSTGLSFAQTLCALCVCVCVCGTHPSSLNSSSSSLATQRQSTWYTTLRRGDTPYLLLVQPEPWSGLTDLASAHRHQQQQPSPPVTGPSLPISINERILPSEFRVLSFLLLNLLICRSACSLINCLANFLLLLGGPVIRNKYVLLVRQADT